MQFHFCIFLFISGIHSPTSNETETQNNDASSGITPELSKALEVFSNSVLSPSSSSTLKLNKQNQVQSEFSLESFIKKEHTYHDDFDNK